MTSNSRRSTRPPSSARPSPPPPPPPPPPATLPHNSSRWQEDLAVWLLSFSASFAAQWRHIFPDVGGGDSGELVAEACLMGVAHPPGYPLFVLLSKLAMRVVEGAGCEVSRCARALSANALSAALGCCASGCIAVVIAGLARMAEEKDGRTATTATTATAQRVSCACFGGVGFSLAPVVWAYTVAAEVFALNNAILGGVMVMLTKVAECPRITPIELEMGGEDARRNEWKRIVAACGIAVLSGAAMSNQHTSVLFVGPVAAAVAGYYEWPPRPHRWAALVMCGVMGLTPYAHLILAKPTPGSWGETSNVGNFLKHFIRKEYGTLRLAATTESDVEGLVERTAEYLSDLVNRQLWPFGAILSVAAIVGCMTALGLNLSFLAKVEKPPRIKRRDPFNYIGVVLLVCYCTYFLVFHSLANIPLSNPMGREVHSRFWIQPHLLVCVWIGLGLHTLLQKFAAGNMQKWFAIGGTWAMLASMATQRRSEAEMYPKHATGAYADFLLQSVPATGAILVAHTDLNWNSVRYKQLCQGASPNVTHLSFQLMPYPWFRDRQQPLYPHISFPPIHKNVSTNKLSQGNSELVVRFTRANWDRYEVYLDMHSINQAQIGQNNSFPGGVYLIPHGVLWKAVPFSRKRFTPKAIEKWRQETQGLLQRMFSLIEELSHYNMIPGTWENAALSLFWDGIYQRALFLLTMGIMFGDVDESYSLLLESTECFDRIFKMLQTRRSFSFSIHDAARNGALAAGKLLNIFGKINNKSYKGSLVSRVMPVVRNCLKAHQVLGDPKDPIFATFTAIHEALEKETDSSL